MFMYIASFLLVFVTTRQNLTFSPVRNRISKEKHVTIFSSLSPPLYLFPCFVLLQLCLVAKSLNVHVYGCTNLTWYLFEMSMLNDVEMSHYLLRTCTCMTLDSGVFQYTCVTVNTIDCA